MAKEGLGGLLSSIGKGVMNNPVGGLGMGKEALEHNPGMKMFGMAPGEDSGGQSSFMDRFKSQMLMRLMGGFGQ